MSRHTFRFLFSMSLFPFSQAAPVAILPSALFVSGYSLGARCVFSFSRCCYLIISLDSCRRVAILSICDVLYVAKA
jgi:hypothetical protein